jgi:hypothetical protein
MKPESMQFIGYRPNVRIPLKINGLCVQSKWRNKNDQVTVGIRPVNDIETASLWNPAQCNLIVVIVGSTSAQRQRSVYK